MTLKECYDTLLQRRNYLRARIRAKKRLCWETHWDVRERDATTFAVTRLAAVEKALRQYYEDLDNHANNGEYMMRTALRKIEKALDMWWGKES